ncbi:oligosaccharide flippase family protein [Gracilibacillus sp. S3-1-1]|uniref:Oligosaccharide flippase family protein n=1 Tax=Gracilibacillus pellucidus TaxID=3095368 RepID=A0ACC6M9K9_9BACI|nr:oligosaccharide flippase family protein [Gracilibacillus sp. S3-1-1]MDX8047542.1 oligosaccharide flippase family protein [Gracilibacillus sp. S3-1-1]
MTSERQQKHVYKGALALLVAGILSKVISAFYRIPLQNLTGDIGFYIYQQVYPIIGIAFMLALYGFPAAISRFLAEHREFKHNRYIYGKMLAVMMLFSALLFLGLFFFSPVLANWMGDNQLIIPLKHISWVFLFVPFVALLRGVTQADEWMEPTAYSQMIEQLLRAAIIIVTAVFIFSGHLGVYQIADGAMIASIVALTASFLFLYMFARKKRYWSQNTSVQQKGSGKLFSSIVLAGIVISLNHMLLLLMQLADAFTMVPGLVKFGMNVTEATTLKGIFDRGQPLLQLVTVVGSSLALALVPAVTKLNWQSNREDTLAKLRLTMKYCLILSLGATVGLITLFPEVNQLLFQNQLGTDSLRMVTISLLFTSLAVTMASTLQGFGYMRWTAYIIFGGLWLKMFLNGVLIPLAGIKGAAIATVITVFVIALLYYLLLRQQLQGYSLFVMPWFKLLLASAMMASVLVIMKKIALYFFAFDNRFVLLVFVIGSVVVGLIVYALVVVKWRVLTKEEWQPILKKGKKGRQ